MSEKRKYKISLYLELMKEETKDLTGIEIELLYTLAQDKDVQEALEARRFGLEMRD